MAAKAVFVVCAQALLIQCITAYVCSEPFMYEAVPYASAQYPGYNPAALAASNGGGIAVTSSSPIAPIGVTMKSDNAFEGPIAVGGNIPFLGAVALEGPLPTAGAGGVSYGSGNGNAAILAENWPANRFGYGNMGYSSQYNGLGCGAVY